MTPNEYQKLTARTEMSAVEQTSRVMDKLAVNQELAHVICQALKLNSESGELADALVKHLSYGQPLDVSNIVEECGDLLWYIARILDHCGVSMEQCMSMNIDKLSIRYPDKFTDQHAKNRLDKVTVPSHS